MNIKYEYFGEIETFFQQHSCFIKPITLCVFSGGVSRLLEDALQRPLHWLIGILHANELALRHLLAKFVDKTVGPRVFSGPICKLLASCENLPVVKLEPIGKINFDIEPSDQSTYQMYLYITCCSVSGGIVPESLANNHPGSMSHARWLTTANNNIILLLYDADNGKLHTKSVR